MSGQNRVQAGVPTGGQFAAGARGENDDLAVPVRGATISQLGAPEDHMTPEDQVMFGAKAVEDLKLIGRSKAAGPRMSRIVNRQLTMIGAKRACVLARAAWPNVSKVVLDRIDDNRVIVTSVEMADGSKMFWTWAPRTFSAMSREAHDMKLELLPNWQDSKTNGSGQWIVDAQACADLDYDEVAALFDSEPAQD